MIALPVLFCSDHSFASQKIEAYGGRYSHVATLLPGGTHVLDSRSDVIDGIPPGVQTRPVSYLDHYCVDLYEIPASGSQVQRAYDALWSQLNKPYDKLGILNFARVMLLGTAKDRNWREESAWFCDELAVWSWEPGQSGICPELPITPNRITPGGACLIAGALKANVSRWRVPSLLPIS